MAEVESERSGEVQEVTLLQIGTRTFRPITADPEPREHGELDLLRQRIRQRYKTPTKAAQAWGVTRSAVSNWENGKRRLPEFVKEDLEL